MLSIPSAPVSHVSAQYKELEKSDPLLMENPSRWVMFPIQHPDIWEMYKRHEASFWTAEEIDLAQDLKDWESLGDGDRRFVTHVPSFLCSLRWYCVGELGWPILSRDPSPRGTRFLWLSDCHGEHPL